MKTKDVRESEEKGMTSDIGFLAVAHHLQVTFVAHSPVPIVVADDLQIRPSRVPTAIADKCFRLPS